MHTHTHTPTLCLHTHTNSSTYQHEMTACETWNLTWNIRPLWVITSSTTSMKFFSFRLKNASIHVNKVTCQMTMTVVEILMRRVLGEAPGVNKSVFKGRKAGLSCLSESVCPSGSLTFFAHLCPNWSALNVTHKLCPCYKHNSCFQW